MQFLQLTINLNGLWVFAELVQLGHGWFDALGKDGREIEVLDQEAIPRVVIALECVVTILDRDLAAKRPDLLEIEASLWLSLEAPLRTTIAFTLQE